MESQVFPLTVPDIPLDESSGSAAAAEEFEDKLKQDRAKRFEYLLKQTEIFTHFMHQKKISTPKPQARKRKAPKTKRRSNKTKKDENENVVECSPNEQEAPSAGPPDEQLSPFDTSPQYIKNGEMRRYQIMGLNWMISLYKQGINGILADEMGLGKTLQTISFLGYLKHYENISGYHLIIVPLSTLTNWMIELKRFCPSLRAIKLSGNKPQRKKFVRNVLLPGDWDVCVTSYEICRLEIGYLNRFKWRYVVIDEAHRIKNENTMLSKVVRGLDCTNRLLLTGTPLQNNLHELWALLNFLLPDVFGSAEDFDDWFGTRECLDNEALAARLQAVVKPFLLRRVKETAEPNLLPKKEIKIFVRPSKMQREWNEKVLERLVDITNKEGRIVQKRLNNIWMHLRKVANHPYLFEGAEPGPPYTTAMHLLTNSSKMMVLDKLLAKLKSQGSRCLIFSQMSKMLDILEDYCHWREYDYCRLDGSIAMEGRVQNIDEFNAENSKKFIFMMTTRAGGVGINLATADVVIIFDIDCNPQMDLQAEDRVHRIGQQKQVRVFRLIVEHSVEERILERCQEKLQLDRIVMRRGVHSGLSAEVMLEIIRANAEEILTADDLELTDEYYNGIIERIGL